MKISGNGVKDLEFLSRKEILTQKEAASYFSITENTLIKWGKTGIVKPTHIGGRVYYRMQDVKDLFKIEKGESK